MTAYYNDNSTQCCQWLRALIQDGRLPAGRVDDRSIQDVRPSDIGAARAHFFAGIGGWPYALQLAGWPDSWPVWTASCPCQPLSCAGKRGGEKDERHLWPELYRLISECRPPVIFGEQVASKDGLEWLDGISLDLEELGYAVGSSDLPAACIGAPHCRQRLWWVAYTPSDGRERLQRRAAPQVPQDRAPKTLAAWNANGSPFINWKKLLAQSYVGRVDDGVSSFVDIRPRLRAFGNAIVPQIAALFIEAFMETITQHAI